MSLLPLTVLVLPNDTAKALYCQYPFCRFLAFALFCLLFNTHLVDILRDVVDDTAARDLHRLTDRIADTDLTRAAVRLDDRLRDAEQRRAADLVRVEHFLEIAELSLEQQRRQLRAGAVHQHILQFDGKKLARALDALEHDVAAVAVGDDDVALAEHRFLGLNVAGEVEMPRLARFLELLIRFAAQRVALALLRADVQKADARILNAEDLLRVVAAKVGKLQQVFDRALGVRAAVDEHRLALGRRDGRRERRAAKPADALDHERRAREQRAGGAGGNKAVRLLNEGVGNRAVGIRKNEIIDMDIIEAVSMKKEFNYELYETLQMISM